MEKKIYLHPVTKTLSLDVEVCSEPTPVSVPAEPPVYAGPDPIEENIF